LRVKSSTKGRRKPLPLYTPKRAAAAARARDIYHNKAKGGFVIRSGRPPKTVIGGDYYRCESHFDRLNTWLRSKGVNTQKPLHTLQKEYGSLINKAHGIHAASKALRHADIRVTNNFYTDSRARITPGLEKLFASKKSTRLSPRLRIVMTGQEVTRDFRHRAGWPWPKGPWLRQAKLVPSN
jgi:hypothetical protein